jgi:prevent-host-death family protein
MDEIGAFEAKNKLSALLDKVERGEEIVITRRGHAIAKLVPVQLHPNPERSRAAMERLRQRAKSRGGAFDWAEWKRDRDQGRE